MSMVEDKRVIVTGVTSGIGRAIVDKLIIGGAEVVGIARDREKMRELAAAWGPRFRPVVVDLAIPGARQSAFDDLADDDRPVDALVNNAGQCIYDLAMGVPLARWRELLEINVLASIELTQCVSPRLGRGSHVVNISSVTARFAPNAKFGPYAVTKAAVDSFTQSLRLELEPKGVKVTLVVPGLVDTAIYDKVAGFEKTKGKIREQIPTWLRPEDVADAVVWSLSRPAHVVVGEMVLLPLGQAR